MVPSDNITVVMTTRMLTAYAPFLRPTECPSGEGKAGAAGEAGDTRQWQAHLGGALGHREYCSHHAQAHGRKLLCILCLHRSTESIVKSAKTACRGCQMQASLRSLNARCSAQDDVATCFDFFADLARKLDGRQWEPIDLGEEDFKTEVRREPLGVVALITPWNYPLLMAAVSTRM